MDVLLKTNYTKGFMLFVRRVLLKVFKEDINSLSIRNQFNRKKHHFQGYDVVQLINESAFNCVPSIEEELLTYIFANNEAVFLLSCGDDYSSIRYASEKRYQYSILTPYFEGKVTAKAFQYALKYITEPYKILHNHIFKNIKGVIASDLDYHLPLQEHGIYLGMIPNPVNTEKLEYLDAITNDKIIIFHGINNSNYYKKGNDIFEAALAIINKKYRERIEIATVGSLPYSEYIKIYDRAHIVLDQVYSYDQGYNALEAMAKGKVVFTGAEQEWLEYYNLEADTVAINALPDAEKIAQKLEWLILNPEKIIEISKNARAFIEREHDYVNVAETYVMTWTSHQG
ncbi:MAG: glycosyltransferase [Gelidibacter sp.]